MEIFEFSNYKEFVIKWVASLPKKGRGQYRQMAEHLGVSTVVISQVFKGERNLTYEQAFELSLFFKLTPLEQKYFLLLVDFERAGTHSYKEYIQKQMIEIRNQSQNLSFRIPQDKILSEEAKAKFYSSWHYTAIRLFISTQKGPLKPYDISERLGLPLKEVQIALEFLLSVGLCLKEGEFYKVGPRRLHLEAESPFVKTKHINWRVKGFENMHDLSSEELYFSAPMSISTDALPEVRKELLKAIARIEKVVQAKRPESLACLNIDWFKF